MVVHRKPNDVPEANAPLLQVVQAILLLRHRYVLHLRDNKPNLLAAGKWSLIGGEIEGNETPLEAVKREVAEELTIWPQEFKYLWYIDGTEYAEKIPVRSWFFVADVSSVWEKHKLNEGQAVKAFPFQEICKLSITPVTGQAVMQFHQQTNANL
ncbi:MAG: NUDIX domain-containing protein [Nitrospina sp.]|nr:NUDIX domain-containing protein [Nitrospina sp.]MBT3857483.1 NUDIX domain-containing protein [Nitrospina sp.]MBT4104272.1 NUDIX domain-containing protein [Nitrospina sp.]MBT4390572.1 NUDIX domain-containing protein [Nitrospina sp.]MBT4622113.1 NUDIX domain-containing protein [Nitrospina sp.]